MRRKLVDHLESESKELYDRLNRIKNAVAKNVWPTQYFMHYTDHTPLHHSKRVIEYLNDITYNLMESRFRLSTEEIFILLSSAYLHDIGMQWLNEETFRMVGINKRSIDQLDYEDFEKIRKKHGELTEKLIEKSVGAKNDYPDLGLEDDIFLEPIKVVSGGHTATDWSRYGETYGIGGASSIRLRFLVALLRIADALDITFERMNPEQLKLVDLPLKSIFHWYQHYYVQTLNIDLEKRPGVAYIRIRFAFPLSYNFTDLERYFVESIKEKLNNELGETRPHLTGWVNIELDDHEITHTEAKKALPEKIATQLLRTGDAFSNAINISGLRYSKIDELYVKPRQYHTIKEILNRYHIVCITGDAGIGKSYTALCLLYELFLDGYELEKPKDRELEEVVIDLVKNPENRLSGEKAIYIEDPFGAAEYERLVPLVKEFHLLVSIAQKYNARIIITSRRELFERAMGHQARSLLLSSIRCEMLMDSPESPSASYTRKDIQKIIDNYAKLYEAIWYDESHLRNEIYDKLLEDLYTPLGIDLFISEYKHEKDKERLLQGIQNYRHENLILTTMQSIACSPAYEIAFLLHTYVLSQDVHLLKEIFVSKVIPQLDVEDQTIIPLIWDLCESKYREKFKEYRYIGRTFRTFYHPALIEALNKAIKIFPNVTKIFETILDVLVKEENPFILIDIATILLRSLPLVSIRQRDTLKMIIHHDNFMVRAGLPIKLVAQLEPVKNTTRETLLEWLKTLSNDEDAWVCRNVAVAIAKYYQPQTPYTTELAKIFSTLCKHNDPNVRYGSAEAILWYYPDIHDFHKYLFYFREDKDPVMRCLLSDAIVWQFKQLSKEDQEIMLPFVERLLSDDDHEVRGWVQCTVAFHQDGIDHLPSNVIERLNGSLEECNESIMHSAAMNLKWHYDYLAKYKPQFIGMLTSTIIRPSEYSGIIMKTMFLGPTRETIPPHLQDYFVRLSQSSNPETRGWAAYIFTLRYNDFSEKNRENLDRLVNDTSPVTRKIVIKCCAANYSRHEKKMKELLEKFAMEPNIEIRRQLIEAIEAIESEVPIPVTRSLKKQIMEKISNESETR